MEPQPLNRHSSEDSIAMRQQLERISEPWFMNKILAVIGALAFAMLLGWLAAGGQIEMLVLLAVWVSAVLVIVFVRDYWWAPALLVTAASLSTNAVGFRLTGLEVGMVVIAVTFPIKLAMKTLWPAKPKLDPGLFYWALLAFVIVHAIVIYFYSKINAEPGIKNIVKSYYGAIAPLVLYGMLIRYCDPKTVFRTVVILFGIWIVTTVIAIPVFLLGIEAPPLTELKINVDFTNADGAIGLLRWNGQSLFITAMAFWTAARSDRYRLLLVLVGALGIIATLLGGGRTCTFSCIVAGIFFAAVRRRLWLALPVIVLGAATVGICTVKPDILYSLPVTIQRSLTPFNFSETKTQAQEDVSASDEWHESLREESIPYWTQDTTSFWVGHGFKGWDEYLNDPSNAEIDLRRTIAIQMGGTENMFNAVTNIFGLTGLVLYGAFMLQLAVRLWKGRRLSPAGSVERAMCEYSFVNLVTCIGIAPLQGGVPNIILIYWALGVLAARRYLVEPEPAKAVPALPFDRSRQTFSAPSAPLPGNLLAEFSRRQSRLRFERKGRAVQ
jgi:hypothetical protein